jgi:uncharacterized membrane protein
VNTQIARDTKLERHLAILLQSGSWLASAVVATGLLLPSGTRVVTVGIALFIALPIVRVALMLFGFLRRGDYRIAVITALVLAIIILGFVFGMRTNVVAG